jgi:hypothetical protein
MPKKTRNRRAKVLKELIERLTKMQSKDETTRNDADFLLTEVIMLNYWFIEETLKAKGYAESHDWTKAFLLKRIHDIIAEIA